MIICTGINKRQNDAVHLIEVMYTSNIASYLDVRWADSPDFSWHTKILRLVLPWHSQQHGFSQWQSHNYIQLSTVQHHLYNSNVTQKLDSVTIFLSKDYCVSKLLYFVILPAINVFVFSRESVDVSHCMCVWTALFHMLFLS